MARNLPRLKQFRSEGCLSYIFYDSDARQAVVIDPVVESMPALREYLSDHRLVPVAIVDTHTHADHSSASGMLRQETRASIVMSEATLSTRVTRRVRQGDFIEVGA